MALLNIAESCHLRLQKWKLPDVFLTENYRVLQSRMFSVIAQLEDVRKIMINLRQPEDDAHSHTSFQSREIFLNINRRILIRENVFEFIIFAVLFLNIL